MFELDRFIAEHVTERERSMFLQDIEENQDTLRNDIEGKSVLVIGGAGSIGSSFIKAILRFLPKALVVVDINENGLAELTRDLRSSDGVVVPEEYITYPIDYSSDLFRKVFKSWGGFDIVANFSAHKHVRSEKDVFSVEALLRNNVINAKGLLDLLEQFPPETYFCVSTDKAANPVNIMGASKRIMEDLIFSYSDSFSIKTARFANVAFSNGSLPDGFLNRIKKMQPLSAPRDVRRFFVSPEESGQICMLACVLGNNREIFFPKLEEKQMKTFDKVAVDLLSEMGYDALECHTDEEAKKNCAELVRGGSKYPVHFSMSDTSGEKLFEEFYTDDECVEMNRFKSLGVITGKNNVNKDTVIALIDKLNMLFETENVEKKDIVDILADYLPDFKHIETGKSLDSRM